MSDDIPRISVPVSEELNERIEQKAEQLDKSKAAVMRDGDHLEGDSLEDQIDNLRAEIETLEEEIERRKNKVDSKQSMLDYKLRQLRERESKEDEREAQIESALNRIASFLALNSNIDVVKAAQSSIEKTIELSDDYDEVDAVLAEARTRTDDVEPTDYLSQEIIQANSTDSRDDLTDEYNL